MSRPKLLDAFACQGGATRGYRAAGFHVTAVDTNRAHLARNPAEVALVGDAVAFIREFGHEFHAIHASPPCQRYSRGNAANDTTSYPDLIGPTRDACQAAGVPYVIENVAQARDQLHSPILLCGTMFGLTATDDDGTQLHLQRHRLFESNLPLTAPVHVVPHSRSTQWAGAYGGARRNKYEARLVRHGGYVPPNIDVLRQLLGVEDDLMTEQGLFESIPPAYALHVGRQVAHLLREVAA